MTKVAGCSNPTYSVEMFTTFDPQNADKVIENAQMSSSDASTVVLSAQIVETDRAASAILKKMNNLSRSREIVQHRIDLLNAIKSHVHAMAKGGNDYIGNKFEQFRPDTFFKDNPSWANEIGYDPGAEPDINEFADAAEQIGHKDYANRVRKGGKPFCSKAQMNMLIAFHKACERTTYTINPDGTVNATQDGNLWTNRLLGKENMQSAIETQKAVISKIDSQKSMLNTKLQQLLQRKQQLVTMVSETNDSKHKQATTAANGIR